MKNLEVAKLFERAADILALLEENTFKILAYRKIARVLEDLPADIEKLAAAGELGSVPGIGKSSADRIKEYLATGRISDFEDLLSQVPAGVLQMTKIQSLGPKTAVLLWREGGITTIEDLKVKIDDGSLTHLKGLGEKKLQKIKENLAHVETSSGRIRIGEALPIALQLVGFLEQLPNVIDAQYCGSLRRGRETIGDIDIAVSAKKEHAAAIGEALTKHRFAASVIQVGESKTSIRTGNGIQVDVRVVPPESFGAALQYFTGSQAHNVHLRELAVKKKLKLNEWSLAKVEDGKEIPIAGKTEEEIYNALGMAWIPPEMREDRGEVQAAVEAFKKREGRVEKPKAEIEAADAFDLIELTDIRGDLHMHTTASDGSNSIEEMVAEAKERGYSYIAITDHSKSQFQANGLRVDRLIEHAKAVRAVAKEAEKSGILVLAGTECDILADGSMDYEDEVLAQLDWVVASPHAALTQESEAATNRLVRAASNPHVHVMGHPTGRLVPGRRGLEPDMSRVIFAAARAGTAVEINANFHRLDLRDVHVKMAVEANVPVCINTDAHSLPEFDMMPYGVLTARRGWARKRSILNAYPLEKFKQWLKSRKELSGW
jgi:DNA polymerase (family 10)